jgi:zinc protease
MKSSFVRGLQVQPAPAVRTVTRLAVFVCTVCLWAAPPWLAAQSAAPAPATVRPAPMHVVSRQLPNGLRLLMVEDHRTPIINLQLWYHVGSKDERPGRTGFAHLFEHLMFKGSAHVPPEQHSRIIEAMGGVNNAYTTEDVTVYYETFPSNYLARVLWLEADRMGGLNISQENFTAEREVVKEERRVRIDNVPYGRIWEDIGAAAFTVHPYQHSVIGSMQDLDRATVEDVREFFQAYYRPDNATLVLVGDFSADEAARLAQTYFGGIEKPKEPIARVNVTEPPQKAERRLTKSYPDTPLPAVVMAYHMPAEFASDSYPLDLASNILSRGQSSMLYRKLVYEERLAIQASGNGNFTEDPNLFIVLAVMNQGKTPAEGEKAIESVLDQLKNTSVDAQDLQKAKNQQIAAVVLRRQTAQSKAGAVGHYAVIGKDVNLVNTELDRYLKVSAADIQQAAKKYFLPAQRTVMVVEPTQAPAENEAPR